MNECKNALYVPKPKIIKYKEWLQPPKEQDKQLQHQLSPGR
jgi:hypothetical protein